MGINVAGLMVIGVMIIVLSLLLQVSLSSSTDTTLASIQAVDRAGERARTNLSIESTAGWGGANLTVKVKNTGLISVYDFSQMDFIVDYIAAPGGGTQTIARLTYSTTGPGNNQWKKSSISPDDFEPGAWNPGETVTLDAKVSPPPLVNQLGTVAVGTPNGVAVAAIFSSP